MGLRDKISEKLKKDTAAKKNILADLLTEMSSDESSSVHSFVAEKCASTAIRNIIDTDISDMLNYYAAVMLVDYFKNTGKDMSKVVDEMDQITGFPSHRFVNWSYQWCRKAAFIITSADVLPGDGYNLDAVDALNTAYIFVYNQIGGMGKFICRFMYECADIKAGAPEAFEYDSTSLNKVWFRFMEDTVVLSTMDLYSKYVYQVVSELQKREKSSIYDKSVEGLKYCEDRLSDYFLKVKHAGFGSRHQEKFDDLKHEVSLAREQSEYLCTTEIYNIFQESYFNM